MKKEIEVDDWVLCPLTKDDIDEPQIVSKVVKVEEHVIHIAVENGSVGIPKKWCRVVYVQKCNL